jgi:hypothetical protein
LGDDAPYPTPAPARCNKHHPAPSAFAQSDDSISAAMATRRSIPILAGSCWTPGSRYRRDRTSMKRYLILALVVALPVGQAACSGKPIDTGTTLPVAASSATHRLRRFPPGSGAERRQGLLATSWAPLPRATSAALVPTAVKHPTSTCWARSAIATRAVTTRASPTSSGACAARASPSRRVECWERALQRRS